MTTILSVGPLAMVEGAMSFKLMFGENGLEKVEVGATEASRYFEEIVKGRTPEEIMTVVQRICGICPFPYAFAAARSAEAIAGWTLTPQATRLRKLALAGNFLASHVLHVLDLVAPMLMGVPSVLGMAHKDPQTAVSLLALHKLGNDIMRIANGRPEHGFTVIPGGMRNLPDQEVLASLRDRLTKAHTPLTTLRNLIATAIARFYGRWPKLEREYIALEGEGEYPFYEGTGRIMSSEAGAMTGEEFREYITEHWVDHSNAKFVRTQKSDWYMVGALSRLSFNWQLLDPEAKRDAGILGILPFSGNPLDNIGAQLVEIRQLLIDTSRVIDSLLRDHHKEETPNFVMKAGKAPGFLEAPRGLIWHQYGYDEEGLATWAECIIPTGMNLAAMEADVFNAARALKSAGVSDEELRTFWMPLVIRAYDPCNSCAVH